jgi:hypothetical protein
MAVGLPETLIVLLMMGVFWLLPLAAGVWALVTLHRIRGSQEEMRARLAGLERLMKAADARSSPSRE